MELIRAMTAEGADLVAFVHGVFATPANSIFVRMEAATWLADRGFGKPRITTEILQSAPPRPPLDLSRLSIEELRTWKALAEKARPDARGQPDDGARGPRGG